jgi:putative ABC transport system ATP-binding protein
VLNLTNVDKVFQAGDVHTRALNGISLEIEAGEYVAVTGPSGCGKSTLLSVLGLLDAPTGGEYWFEGQNVAGWNEVQLNRLRRGRVGFIFQSFNLIEELSVRENVELALAYSKLAPRERWRRVDAALERLGVSHRAGHRPAQLSGGQQQRVAIARALVASPALLLADEPTGNLDTAHGDEVMKMLREINSSGTTVVMVTHSRSHAAQASRTVNLLDGRVVVDGQQLM